MNALTEWLALYVLDVRQNPTAYKPHVVADPERAAWEMVDGLTEAETRQLTRELYAERRKCRAVSPTGADAPLGRETGAGA